MFERVTKKNTEALSYKELGSEFWQERNPSVKRSSENRTRSEKKNICLTDKKPTSSKKRSQKQ